MGTAWHNLSDRLKDLLEKREWDIQRLMKENAELRAQVAELEDELNAYRRLYSPELATSAPDTED